MIWDIIQQSNFDKHFQNPNLTIQQLLIDENILTQMQNLNPNLLQYINNNLNNIINKLVEYVTVIPKEQNGNDRCYKLPYVSSEILAIDNQILYDAFLDKKQQAISQNFKNLLKFLQTDAIDNQLLLGYFEKVTNNLYKGRKLQFTRAVAANLSLFCNNLHTQTIGNILKNCVILLGQKQGILYQQRKKIVLTLVSNMIQPKNTNKSSQIRQVCSTALVQIIGKHKTYSSGDQLLNYLLSSCGELLIIYSQYQVPQICRFLIGLLKKSTQKIYDPESDTKINIFKIPIQHKKLLQGYLPIRLQHCKLLINSAAASQQYKIKQQDGSIVQKINKNILDYLTLVAVTLQNQIDQFLINNSIDLNFAWECMRLHPKNDIVLVQIDKIFLYVISDRSKNKQKLRSLLKNQFKIIQKFCEIFTNDQKEKLLRPHLFQIWHQLIKWLPQQVKNYNQSWKHICDKYQALIPLHDKATGLNYKRPTNIKIVIDEQDKKTTEENLQNRTQKQHNNQNSQGAALREESFLNVNSTISNINNYIDEKQRQKEPEFQQFAVQKQKQQKKQLGTFNQFDYFFSKSQQKQSQKDQAFADFSQFG